MLYLNFLRFTKHFTTRDSLALALACAKDCRGVPLAMKFVKTLAAVRKIQYWTDLVGLNIALTEVR
jgi:hypothetical protein